MSDTYKEDGVDVVAGDSFSAATAKLIKTTYGNCPFIEVMDFSKGVFRGPRPFRVVNLPGDYLLDAGPDGVGTKVNINDALLLHPDSANDLIAMTCGDITRFGGLPAVFWNVLEVSQIGEVGSESYLLFVSMLEKLVQIASKMNLVVHKGETAETGDCVGSNNPSPHAPYNWSGTALGIFQEDKVIYGNRVQPGDIVVALQENGFRSNGISSVRAAFERKFEGENYYELDEARIYLRLAAQPSVLYDKFLSSMHGWTNYEDGLTPFVDMRLIAHITGGGMGKFVELLATTGLSAVLDDLFELPKIMRICASWRGMTDSEVYRTWNGGQGALVVLPPTDVDIFLEYAEVYGIKAKICGLITPSTSQGTKVKLSSKYQGFELTLKP